MDGILGRAQGGEDSFELAGARDEVAAAPSFVVEVDHALLAQQEEVLRDVGLGPFADLADVSHALRTRQQGLQDGQPRGMPQHLQESGTIRLVALAQKVSTLSHSATQAANLAIVEDVAPSK